MFFTYLYYPLVDGGNKFLLGMLLTADFIVLDKVLYCLFCKKGL